MTTTSYRTQFGRVAFSCKAGTKLFLPVSTMLEDGATVNGLLDNNPSHAVIYTALNRPYRLPNEVLEAGRSNVTALVHSLAATTWFWGGLLKPELQNHRLRIQGLLRQSPASGKDAEELGQGTIPPNPIRKSTLS
jgi:hypothetical protein